MHWGIVFRAEGALPSHRKAIEQELKEILANVPSEQITMKIVDYFINTNRYADALYTLELAKQKDPANLELTKKYWLTLNDMFIKNGR